MLECYLCACLPLLLLPFLKLIAVFIEAHEPRDGRIGTRHNLNKVDFLLRARELERFLSGHDAEICSVSTDYAELLSHYFTVDTGISDSGEAVRFSFRRQADPPLAEKHAQ